MLVDCQSGIDVRGPYDPLLKEAIGERLKLTRLALGFHSQVAIVRALDNPNITTQHWNNWESGRVRMGVDSALALTKAFNVSLDWVFRGTKDGLPTRLARAIEALEAAQNRKGDLDGYR